MRAVGIRMWVVIRNMGLYYMSDIVISVENLSKRYGINHRCQDDGIRHILEAAVRSPLSFLGSRRKKIARQQEEFWALQDVSFEVVQGEVLGILGSNGAGKSTLLKILSRISDPTGGRISMTGRVASLLEVGTGFHPELTGRENVFLNGAILGMRREEIRAKFDQIVEFAEIQQFLDTPVKRYSSGMYVRLAFSVAAHLDPDIMIVDEVLAVGDAAFQRKCLGKIEEARHRARTVLFVSHNVAAMESFCTRCLVLKHGRVAFDGPCKEAIAFYLKGSTNGHSDSTPDIIELMSTPSRASMYQPQIKRLEMFGGDGQPLRGSLPAGKSMQARITVELVRPAASVCVELAFFTLSGQRICTAHSAYESKWNYGRRAGEQVFICDIASLPLVPGQYQIQLGLDVALSTVDCVEDAARITVEKSDFYGTGIIPTQGLFMLGNRWNVA